LRESTKLYDLPRADLEKLVGQVVREEGFSRLVRLAALFLKVIANDDIDSSRTWTLCGGSWASWHVEDSPPSPLSLLFLHELGIRSAIYIVLRVETVELTMTHITCFSALTLDRRTLSAGACQVDVVRLRSY
jgi:hypothetical protein